MSSILSTNMASLYAQRNLASAQAELAGSVQKLSSGKQINSARDNAAGLGISEGVMGVRNISDQSIRNLQNATSLVQTADGALDVVSRILQRALTLSTQKNETILNAEQIGVIDNEIASLVSEIGRIKDRTRFNSGGSIFGETYSFGAGSGVTTTFTIPELGMPELGINFQARSIAVNSVTLDRSVEASVAAGSALTGTSSGRETTASLSAGTAVTGTSSGRQATATVSSTGTPITGANTPVVGTASVSDTFNIAHTYTTGTELIYRSGSGNSIGGLVDGNSYYVIRVDANSFKLASSSANATAGTAIDLTDVGSATDASFIDVANPDSFAINAVGTVGGTTTTLQVTQDWLNNSLIFFDLSAADPSKIGDLVDGGIYVVQNQTPNSVTLKDYFTNAVIEFEADDDLSGARLSNASLNQTLASDSTSNEIRLTGHGFSGGEKLFYTGPTQNGLINSTMYYVSTVDGVNSSTRFKLATSVSDALAKSNLIDITGSNPSVGIFSWANPSGAADITQFGENPLLPPNTLVVQKVDPADASLSVGQTVTYIEGNAPITGLVNNAQYTVISSTNNAIQLASSGTPVSITGSGDLTGASFERESSLVFNSGSSSVVNARTNEITTSATHGFALGDAVYYNTSGVATVIGGLTNNTKYYAIPTSTTSFQLAASASDATAGTEIALTGVGSGTQNFTFMPASNALQSTSTHNFTTGEAILYAHSGAGSAAIGGLSNNTTYYAIESTSNTFKLAANAGDALAGTAITITSPGTGTQSFTPVSDVLSANAHGFSNTNAVVYTTTGTPIGGLTNNTTYYVRSSAANTFELAASPGGAKINLTSAGSGTQTFTYMPGTNALTINGHGFAANEPIVYSTTGTPIGGLTSGTTYYAIQDTTNTFKLAAAVNGSAITLTSPGTGTQSFTPVSDVLSANAHGFSNTNAVVYSTTGTPIGGLTNGATYYVRSASANTFELAASPGGAKINLTSAGSGTQTFTYMPGTNAITISNHGFAANEPIIYNTTGTEIGGLVSGTTYYAIQDTTNTFKLAAAVNGSAITLTSPGSGTQSFTPVSDVLSANAHGLSTGDAVLYANTGGTEIGGLTNNTTYYVINSTTNTFELAASPGGAKINLTSTGSGTHSFMTDADSIRSTAHGLSTGDAITYDAGSGSAIGGLVDGTTYNVIRIDADLFNLAVDENAAQNGTAINLTGTGNNAQTFSTESGSISTASIVGAITVNASNRAELGSRLNALSYAIDNLQTLSNNLSEAYSRIVDTDYAAETAALTRNQILQQAATSMLAQANQMPNVILTLLK